MRTMKNKKAASHIEIVLSFVIFVGFLIFLFAIFQPTKIGKKSEIIIDNLERSFKERVSSQLYFFTINTNESIGCFIIEYALNDNQKVIVKDSSRKTLNANSSASEIFINGENNNFFFIYISQDFNENEGSFFECRKLEKTAYNVGLLRNYDVVSYKALEELKTEYDNNYERLKSGMNIPNSQNFAFIIKDVSGTEIISGRKRLSKAREVFAREIPIELAEPNGDTRIAILNLQIW